MSQPRRRPRIQFSRSFKGWLLSPVILLFLSACRLLLVANYDSTTAMTIASTVGAISTLLGTMIPILSAFLPAIALAFAAIRSWRTALLAGFAAVVLTPAQQTASQAASDVHEQLRSAADQFNRGSTQLLERTDLMWAGGFALVWILVGIGLIIWPPVGYTFQFFEPEEEEEEHEKPSLLVAFGRVLRPIALFVVGMGAFFFVQNAYSMTFTYDHLSQAARLPWMAPEHITITDKQGKDERKDGDGGKDEERTEIAYVLTVGGEWTVLLAEDTRTISYVPSPEVKKRTVCELPATRTSSRPPLFPLKGAERADLPDCDDLNKESTE